MGVAWVWLTVLPCILQKIHADIVGFFQGHRTTGSVVTQPQAVIGGSEIVTPDVALVMCGTFALA